VVESDDSDSGDDVPLSQVATAPKPRPRVLSDANATPLGPPKAPVVASVRCQVAQGATKDVRNVEVVTATSTDDVFESDSAENLPPLVTSPADSDEEADIVTQAVVASQAVVAVPRGSQSP
jgi:hypothetical protein